MKHEPVIMYSREWLEHAAKHGRKATRPDGKTRNATSRHTPQKTHIWRPNDQYREDNNLHRHHLMLIIFLTIGTCISMQWYTSTHHDFQMETVKTGDVTWVCLTDRGTTIGCDTVEEYR